jgi:hypothetical protein
MGVNLQNAGVPGIKTCTEIAGKKNNLFCSFDGQEIYVYGPTV